MDRWMDGRIIGRMDGWTTDGRMNRKMMEGWMIWWMDNWVRMDGWMDQSINGWMFG